MADGFDPDEHTRRLAAEALADDDPTGWFERLYAEAEAGVAVVPWDREAPQRLLVEWTQRRGLAGDGRAVVVGCGYGRDAEHVRGLGFDTVAFDVSATAIDATRRRFPGSTVEYVTGDLLDLPAAWRRAFDLVVESITVQALPPPLHDRAIAGVRSLVAPDGTLLVVASGRAAETEVDGPPWPLTRDEIAAFGAEGLTPVVVERIGERGAPEWIWRAEFHRIGT